MNELLWFVSRATGVVSIVLLTAVVVLGIVLAGRRTARADHAAVVTALHRWLGLGVAAFLVVHIATAILETYVPIGIVSAVVPFTSGYAPVWVGLGTLALDLVAAIAVTSYWRHRMPERAWRAVHLLSYALWPMALAHGIALGTSVEPVLRGITILCGIVGAAAIAWRLQSTPPDRTRRDRALEQVWS